MTNGQLVEIKKGQTGKGLLIEHDGFISLGLEGNRQLKESLEESNGDLNKLPRPFIVSAVFQKYDIENANGRIYPERILKREVEKYQEVIKDRRGYGNNNHPEDNQIDVNNIGMNIIELHWEGHTLVGKMEIPITEGFRRYGIVSTSADQVAQLLISNLKIGVSSRALGSVRQEFGKLIVGDDLELTCWDVVCQPSTNSAFIEIDERNLQPYIESYSPVNKEVIKEDKINNKFSKFENWLND